MTLQVRSIPLFSELYDRGRGDIAQFALDFLEMPPPMKTMHPGQVKWLHNYPFCAERSLGCANRWGKSTCSAVKLAHHAFYQTRLPIYSEFTHEYLAVSLSITLDMANIAWHWVSSVLQNSKLMKRFVLDIKKRDPFPVLIMGDGNKWRSEIWSRSTAHRGIYLLGKSFDFVNWDEAARDPQGRLILDDVLRMRMVDRHGRIDMTSTGAGKNWFYKQCQQGVKDAPDHLHYYFQTGSTYENPSISRDRIEETKGRMSSEMVRQNIYGEFVDFASVFDLGAVETCYRGVDYHLLTTPDEAKREIKNFPPDASFAMGIDFGRKRDETVILVARTDVSPARIVYAQGMSTGAHWDDIYDACASVHHTFRHALCVADATAHGGDICTDILTGERYNVKPLVPYNFAGSKGRKEHLLTVGQMATEKRSIIWPYIQVLHDQLMMYDRMDKYLATDWVMAFCLMAEGVRRSTEQVAAILPAQFMAYALRRDFYDETIDMHTYTDK